MRSKTFCFKKVLIQKATLRFWPAWALYLLVLFFAVLIPVCRIQPDTDRIVAFDDVLTFLKAGYHPVMIFCFSILFALLVFSWLYTARSCNMMHAFPFRRSQLFASHYIAGLAFLVVPQIIILLAVMPGCLHYGILPGTVGRLLLFALACDFVFYTTAVFCCMLAGHILSALVYYLIFHSVAVIIRILVKGIYASYGYGLTSGDIVTSRTPGDFLSPVVFIASRCGLTYDNTLRNVAQAGRTVRVECGISLLLFVLVSVGILIFAALLYRVRNVECAGEMSAFRVLNPVIRWIVAVCCGIATGFFLAETLFNRGNLDETFPYFIVLFIIFSLVWFVAAEMVLKKTFRIFRRKIWAEWGVLCAVILCLVGAIRADAFHVVRYVPESEEVAAVMAEANYTVASRDADDIEKVIDLHQAFLEHREAYQEAEREYVQSLQKPDSNQTAYMQNVTIKYFLKNGKTVVRIYDMPVTPEEIAEADSAISAMTRLETPKSALETMLGKDYSTIQFTNAELDGKELTGEETEELFAALKQDLEEGKIHYQTRDLINRPRDAEGDYLDDSITISLAGEAPGRYHSGLTGIIGTEDELANEMDTWDDGYTYGGGWHYLMGGVNISVAEVNYLKNLDQTNLSVCFWINSDCSHTCEVLKKYGIISSASDIDDILEQYHEETNLYGRG